MPASLFFNTQTVKCFIKRLAHLTVIRLGRIIREAVGLTNRLYLKSAHNGLRPGSDCIMKNRFKLVGVGYLVNLDVITRNIVIFARGIAGTVKADKGHAIIYRFKLLYRQKNT
ncbi:hypothetical protein SDC9_128252 [bioreactor metagenome]|uniref:Uncharacterized protein n=1 Tax=bioreactor metagenome TaxID=1076179 RepID=A0A645CVL9_9ZZZZ